MLVPVAQYGQNEPVDIATLAIYKTDGIGKEIDYLFSTNKYSESSQSNSIKDNLNQPFPLIVHFTGYTLITTKILSNDITRIIFIAKYERGPLFFKLLFYKPADK